ncbi:zinc finger protein with KRAB and SCAN domains 8-like [Episyrphus balteatus]|uniref:zinc finger protein with KRAB and SCAN domains 8-like n=1 Tax=Episyrphus balteatus TaxID=286459 RepID=UPI002485DD7D|nr:zinc finger protein with KRAB and SCAN domains 8-like [Episyrphus balteatus]
MGDIVETRQSELRDKKICRFCLTQNASDLTNIYSRSRENRVKTAPLPLQVMACVSIEVFSNDCMPGYVCSECRLIFDYCYRFKQMCKKADTCLRHYPLTGQWSPAMDHPKIPTELLQKEKSAQKNLNALQVPKPIEVVETIKEIVEEEEDQSPAITIKPENIKTQIPNKKSTQTRQQSQKTDVEIDEPDAEEEYTPKKAPVSVSAKSAVRKTSVVKILNKSAIRILNKEAQRVIEPIMTKPVLQRDDDGNLSIVTQILEQDVPDIKESLAQTTVLETNVYPCPHCERSFPLQQLLDIHLVNHNRERSFFCEFCDKSFFSKYDLQKHNLTHTGEKPYKCVVCNKGFTRSTLLHRHEKTHTDIPKFICVFCEKSFISQEEMEKHTERHRKHRPFVCKICNKAFAFKQGLERHEVVHCRQQPFQCQYCDQSFPTPSKLSRHLTAHAGKRPYPCKLCPKSYLLSHHLTRHMRSHKNGSGSYKCIDCQKPFNTRDDLIYHSAVHAAQTMVCPLCKDAFDDIETVTEHVRQHAEGEAYACEFCDFIYMTNERLEEHTKASHADEMVAYDEDTRRNALAEKNAKNQDTNSNETSTKEMDEVIEEFLYEEFPDDTLKKEETEENVIVKDEAEWENQLDNHNQASIDTSLVSTENETIDEETLELMNIIEMSEQDSEPPAKIKKIYGKPAEVAKVVSVKQTQPLRRKVPIKSGNAISPASSSSSSPKENKKPQQATPAAKIISVPKAVVKPPVSTTPKTRQPTIQAALKAISKSVSVKKIETPNKTLVTGSIPKPVETETPTRKTSPRVAAVKQDPSQQNKVSKPSPNTNQRMLRQRSETTPEVRVQQVKASPVSKEIKKSPQKPAALVAVKKIDASQEDKKLVEMVIDDKKVKVKKITMSKAQVAEMTRDGRIQMKGGTMILKKNSA